MSTHLQFRIQIFQSSKHHHLLSLYFIPIHHHHHHINSFTNKWQVSNFKMITFTLLASPFFLFPPVKVLSNKNLSNLYSAKQLIPWNDSKIEMFFFFLCFNLKISKSFKSNLFRVGFEEKNSFHTTVNSVPGDSVHFDCSFNKDCFFWVLFWELHKYLSILIIRNSF